MRFSFALLFVPVLALAGTVSLTLEFRPEQFVFDKADGFDVVALPGEYTTSAPGEPCLPLAAYNVVIPPDAEVTGIEVTEASWQAVPGEFDIHPCQRPRPLSQPAPAFVEPDDKTYGSHETYPTDAASFTRSTKPDW